MTSEIVMWSPTYSKKMLFPGVFGTNAKDLKYGVQSSSTWNFMI